MVVVGRLEPVVVAGKLELVWVLVADKLELVRVLVADKPELVVAAGS